MELHGMTRDALEAWALGQGAAPGAARLLASHELARQASLVPAQDQRPSASLLAAAQGELSSGLPPATPAIDPDGTVRFAVRLDGGELVETVAIFQPAGSAQSTGERKISRWTLCVSSQAGCSRGCTFCETGRLGLVRNLSAAEIVQQVALATRFLVARGEARPRNVVFMGMGEPLDNLDQVVRAIDVLQERGGFAVPVRRITVSTVGIVPRMDELYARTRANLAVSLHAIDEETRRSLLPVARRWPLAELRAAIARSPRPVLLQWTLIEGVNDADPDADALAAFCEGLEVRVNLIPLNPGPLAAQRAPALDRCRAFQARLAGEGVRTILRMPHGLSVGGACGQLAGSLRA